LTGVNTRLPEEKTEDVLRNILEQVSRQASIDFRPIRRRMVVVLYGRKSILAWRLTCSRIFRSTSSVFSSGSRVFTPVKRSERSGPICSISTSKSTTVGGRASGIEG